MTVLYMYISAGLLLILYDSCMLYTCGYIYTYLACSFRVYRKFIQSDIEAKVVKWVYHLPVTFPYRGMLQSWYQSMVLESVTAAWECWCFVYVVCPGYSYMKDRFPSILDPGIE